jgi:hypothetical protein
MEMRSSRLALALAIFAVLAFALTACFQTPPAPEEPAGASGIVRDLNVPGTLTARMATIRDSLTVNGGASVGTLSVRNELSLPDDTLTTDVADVTDLTADTADVITLTVDTVDATDLTADTADVTDLTADTADVITLTVTGGMIIPADSLTTAALADFYFPLVLSGNITESFTFTDTIAAVLLPNDVTVGGMDFFSRAISNTVTCNVLYTTVGITPTMNTIAITSTVLTAGEVMTSSVDNDTLGAGYLVEFVCDTDAGGYARDVMVTLWLK